MSLATWERACASCRVGGAIPVEFSVQPVWGHGAFIGLVASCVVPDRVTGRAVTINVYEDAMNDLNEEECAERLLAMAERLYSHEVHEQFSRDGVRLFDPHAVIRCTMTVETAP